MNRLVIYVQWTAFEKGALSEAARRRDLSTLDLCH